MKKVRPRILFNVRSWFPQVSHIDVQQASFEFRVDICGRETRSRVGDPTGVPLYLGDGGMVDVTMIGDSRNADQDEIYTGK
jgi:hypothetical protein